MPKPKNCLGYPRDRLSVEKHRQLARQVRASDGFACKTSTDLDNMFLLAGSTFVFGSWICEAGGDGKLQGRLLKNLEHHEAHAVSATTADRLTKRISQLTMSNPTRISWMTDSDSNSDAASGLESRLSSLYDGLSPFPFGLRNMAASYQALLQDSANSVRMIPLTGA
jgi:hypothetical protein